MKKLLLLILASLLFVGCSAEPAPEETKKVLRVAFGGDVLSLDSTVATDGVSFEVLTAFTEGLVEYDANDATLPGSGAAESWTVSDDGLEYVFSLKKDAVWSNGDPVTANDFVFAWRRLVDPALANEYSLMAQNAKLVNADAVIAGTLPVEELGVEAVDDYTLKVSLETPVPWFIPLMTFPSFFPMNEKFVTEAGDNYATGPDFLLSNSAFVLTEWVQGSQIVLAKNDKYYDADKIAIDGIEISIIADPQTVKLQYDQGNLDVAAMSGDLVTGYVGTDDFVPIRKGYTWFMPFNQKSDNAAVLNENFRLALAWAFDREFIVNEKLNDGSIVADGFVPRGLAASVDGVDFRDAAPKYFGYDAAKALEYWEAAKAELGVDSVTFELLVGTPGDDSGLAAGAPEYIKAEVEKNLPGVTVEIKTVLKKERLDLMKPARAEYDVALTRWGPDYADPLTYLQDLLVTGSNYNYNNWSDPVYDAMVAEVAPGGALSTVLDARWAKLIEVEAYALDTAIVVPLWQTGSAMVIKPNVKGIEYHVLGMTNYKRATID